MGNTWYGTMVVCALPTRAGSVPVTSACWVRLTRLERVELTSETLMFSPRPVTLARISAPRMPTAAFSPVSTSVSATPTLLAGPSAGPVVAIRPLSACTTMSKPGRVAGSCSGPKPLTEQYTSAGLRLLISS